MKQIIYYVCEKCGFKSEDAKSVEECEARHLNLSVEEYRNYLDLKREAAHYGSIVSETNNEQTRKQFDIACEELTDFEVKHGIE